MLIICNSCIHNLSLNLSMTKRSHVLLQSKYKKIFERYTQMYFGQMMRDEKIYEILCEEFHLMPKTLYGIVLKMSKLAAQKKEEDLV